MINNLKNKKKKKAFTLIELIIVIAIIAILSAIALPKFGEIRKNANIKADIATAKNIHSAVTAVVQEKNLTTIPADIMTTAIGYTPTSNLDKTKNFLVKLEGGNVVVYVEETETTDIRVYPNGAAPYNQ